MNSQYGEPWNTNGDTTNNRFPINSGLDPVFTVDSHALDHRDANPNKIKGSKQIFDTNLKKTIVTKVNNFYKNQIVFFSLSTG